MANRKFLPGILVIALIFGMTVIGCEEEEENLSPPTGLSGTVISPNNSIRLSWDPVKNASEYRIEYQKNSNGYLDKYNITNTSYTFTDLDYCTKYYFRVAAATDRHASDFSSPISVDTGNPLTGNVSVFMETTCFYLPGISSNYLYNIIIKLTLSDGAYWDRVDTINGDLFKSWVTMSGTPNVNTWDAGLYDYSNTPRPQTIQFSFTNSSATNNVSISGLTVTLATSKLTEMKGYTNVVNSLTNGTPSFASSSEWVKTGNW